ncbi:hypothetical protein F443_03830 [Phytophthora nicotianae P1569]|uniref:Uncharacterized protein n=2 Tax=Phytophthora nicotianae TaxID=4792 RepID=V9FS13_PHYNI|nr:hypothetical protein F443_03830 [Phytophthora nicotianae P1569]
MEFGGLPGREENGEPRVAPLNEAGEPPRAAPAEAPRDAAAEAPRDAAEAPRPRRDVPAVRKVAAATKAPKYDLDGGFDLYRARLESYLRQRNCWSVVIGTENPDPRNEENQRNYEERNLFARDTLLFGLLAKDAKKVCKFTRVSEMWSARCSYVIQRLELFTSRTIDTMG